MSNIIFMGNRVFRVKGEPCSESNPALPGTLLILKSFINRSDPTLYMFSNITTLNSYVPVEEFILRTFRVGDKIFKETGEVRIPKDGEFICNKRDEIIFVNNSFDWNTPQTIVKMEEYK